MWITFPGSMNGADYEIFYQKTVCLYIYRINGRHNFIVLVY